MSEKRKLEDEVDDPEPKKQQLNEAPPPAADNGSADNGSANNDEEAPAADADSAPKPVRHDTSIKNEISQNESF